LNGKQTSETYTSSRNHQQRQLVAFLIQAHGVSQRFPKLLRFIVPFVSHLLTVSIVYNLALAAIAVAFCVVGSYRRTKPFWTP